ncbi:APC family permease [Paenibacillus apiarius]|uniref:APC family permease n=1 Tax=Paenibacillus apiarius TaxID=46240 RepID=A0ABT4DY40_9BACL|nr:APC family permease [Paenibacillus apiarius]MCY9517600.1 APC family permease [Paenibacillus apiarius]MCY9522140.1 APC family permease [Paenibacillus apiarius]MCY9559220.1 APC family permease [Paenibacillus apiarius]MCY9683643.1 APC family permease [Paenibacillus apiarius]MCY9726428.1 APC family permease [Paenibacillus apiarius]
MWLTPSSVLMPVSTLAEETHNPTKTIPKVMLSLALFIGIMYVILTYFMQTVFPDVTIFSSPDGVAFVIAQTIGGMLFSSFFLGVVIASCLVGGVSAQMGISRLLFAMGRDRVLPNKVFGYLHPTTGIPVFNIVFTGVFAGLLSLFLTLEQVASIISFGAYIAFTFVNLCVIRHYYFKQRNHSVKGILQYVLLPLLGILFIALMWYNISHIALVLEAVWNSLGFVILLF